MANLTYQEKAVLEELFEMSTGYVMDFSNNSFSRFVSNVVRIDIYGGLGYENYTSKANKVRQIWDNEPDSVVGTLLDAMLDYCEDYRLRTEKLTDFYKKRITNMRTVAKRLEENIQQIQLPVKQEDDLKTLQDDIHSALARNKPELVLDRLHVFSTKLLRHICEDNGITTKNNKGEYLPLHSLAGMLRRKYEQEQLFKSSFTTLAIQNSISLFDRYNAIRNDQSYAHDNDVLGTMEANFAVRIMSDLITFIDKVETHRKSILNESTNNEDADLPF